MKPQKIHLEHPKIALLHIHSGYCDFNSTSDTLFRLSLLAAVY